MPLNTADAIKAPRQAASAADNSDRISDLTAKDRSSCMRPHHVNVFPHGCADASGKPLYFPLLYVTDQASMINKSSRNKSSASFAGLKLGVSQGKCLGVEPVWLTQAFFIPQKFRR